MFYQRRICCCTMESLFSQYWDSRSQSVQIYLIILIDLAFIYIYIKTKPGAYIGEIANIMGLNRGTLRHHLKILKLENMIEAYCDRGKIRYFENNSTYEEKEKQIILALQNEMTRKIILKVLEEECNTNRDIVQTTGVSKGAITWYMKQLKELDLIEENKVGRFIMYSINPAYLDTIKKYSKIF